MITLASDPYFPQIPKILDSGYMRETLQNALFPNKATGRPDITVESCHVGEKRYKPGKSFMLTYMLHLQNTESGDSYDQILTARLRPSGIKPEGELNTSFLEAADLSIGKAAGNYLPELGMMLWPFPHDRKLAHLSMLLNPVTLYAYFTRYLSALNLSSKERIVSVQPKIMHYLPEQSCMIRYTLGIADSAVPGDENIRALTVYGKSYYDDCGKHTYAIMKQLAGQTAQCAKPLHYDADINTVWQAHVPGEPFEWTPNLIENPGLIRKVAQCIAAFHHCRVEADGRYGFAQINRQLESACKLAMETNPALGQRVRESVQELLRIYAFIDWEGTGFEAPLHMDLKMGNLLVSNRNVFLIDLDGVCLGDPLADLGSFIANLYLNGLRTGAGIADIDGVAAMIVKEYGVTASFNGAAVKLNWYIASALIHEVLRRSLRQHSIERLNHVNAYLELSKRYSALCSQGIGNV